MVIRKATRQDIDRLVQLRLDYLTEDEGPMPPADREKIVLQLGQYFEAHIGRDFVAVLAEKNGEILSSAYMVVCERPANPLFITGKTGVLLNVLTYPAYRRRGIATKVLQRIIAEAKQMEVAVIDLFATEKGEPVYRKLGFREPAHRAMRLFLQ